MTKTTFNPKTLTVEQNAQSSRHEQPPPVTREVPKVQKSDFARSEPKNWKRLTNETPSEIGPLVDALHGTSGARPMSKKEALKELLSMFAFGERGGEEKPSAKDLDVPPVPQMEDLLKMPGVFDHMKPVVDRYLALEKTYVLLLRETRRSIRHGGMHAQEVERRQMRETYLERGLANVRRELGEARYYYEWQKLRDKAAKAEAKDEFDRIP